ncbi:uncharacterized protein Triagg1_4067 [Trichoderma aggressivum f. europaeum]|uniref:AB hydrolase-1 domain-containing protein n=1 Tax=Trichoderma aggressivum f. europaeum TaxID=173218 RepID=A0AAE1IEG7_9HYPO|nr:hypothetical protein Triagg1_4067 [Trichoderma aggressivum f. europaeum]
MAAVSSSPKPHILIIPGAWYPASNLDTFIESLEAAGYSAEAFSLLSFDTAGVSVQDDEEQVKASLTSLVDNGKSVIIVAHSYGGLVASGVIASPGLDKRTRELQGSKGGVVGIVYLAAIIPAQDEGILQLVGGKWLEYIDDTKAEAECLLYTFNPTETFHHDCSAELASSVTKTLLPHSELALKTAPSAVGWKDEAYDGRRAYIRCLQDKALPIGIQEHLVARSEVEWVVKTLDSSHSPFLSMPGELTRVLEEIVEEFAKR